MQSKTVKSIIVLGAALLPVGVFMSQSKASLLLTANFDAPSYTQSANLAGQAGWTAISAAGTNPIKVASGSVSLTTSGEDDSVVYTSQTSGSVYFGIDIRLSAAQTGDYFASLVSSSSGTFGGRLFAKSSGSGFALGVSGTSATATYASSPKVLSFGTTYRVVVKYTFVSGAANDTVTLYLSPSSFTEGNNTAEVTMTNTGQTDLSAIAAFALRQGTAGNMPTVSIVDNLQVANDFSTAAVPEPTGLSLMCLTAGGLLSRRRRIRPLK